MRGPFASCAPLESNGGSLLPDILSPLFLAQNSCQASCRGTPVNGSSDSSVCVELKNFKNVQSLVANNLPCIVDKTSDLRGKRPSVDQLVGAIQPGICSAGTCRVDSCRETRCSDHGECVLSNGALSQIQSFAGADRKTNGTHETSLISCRCDSGFFGRMCQYQGDPSSVCLDCLSPVESIAETNGWITHQQYVNAILVAVFATCLYCLLMAALIICVRRRLQKRVENQSSDFMMKPLPVAVAASASNHDYSASRYSPVGSDTTWNATNTQMTTESDIADQSVSAVDKPLPNEEAFESAAPATIETAVRNDNEAVEALSSANTAATDSPSAGGYAKAAVSDASVAAATAAAAATGADLASSAKSKKDIPEIVDEGKQNQSSTTPILADTKLPASYLRAAHPYNPRLADELQLSPSDLVYIIKSYDDGWARGMNMRTGREGIFPFSFCKQVGIPAERLKGYTQLNENDLRELEKQESPSESPILSKDFPDTASDRASSLDQDI